MPALAGLLDLARGLAGFVALAVLLLLVLPALAPVFFTRRLGFG
jgi:hypothetical protein